MPLFTYLIDECHVFAFFSISCCKCVQKGTKYGMHYKENVLDDYYCLIPVLYFPHCVA